MAGAVLVQERRRGANAFVDALEGEASPTTAADEGRALERLLAVASALEDMPQPTLDPEVRTVQRAQLIAAMEAMVADGTLTASQRRDGRRGTRRATARGLGKLRPRSRWSRGLAAGGLSVGVAAGAFGGASAASTDALPGGTLYGLKRGMEDLRLGLADDGADRGVLYLDLASTRLNEARHLMERSRGGELDDESLSEIRSALSGLQQQASKGHRLLSTVFYRDGSLQPVEALSAFSADHRKGWSELRERLPAKLDDVSDKVTAVFDAIEQEVRPLRRLLPPADGSRPGDRRDGSGSANHSGKGTQPPAPPSPGSPDSSLPPLLPGFLPGLGLSEEPDSDS
ncbi:DUF5667 domain-containing protein [Streptomyces sp. NBC_01210]|uniref:DUF5667 domain-containing protein n=1 Tax=Streptomyces sp. NBC_01210 TaxID=2903774 RepID=UPI003FA3623D|nr:DUF5667 domain-containing protein [Streptomyces sp. NBC_01210]